MRKTIKSLYKIVCAILLLFFNVNHATAQTTAFTYQGKLTDGANLANGNYDMQFKLFDTATVGTGTQQGSFIANASVTVTAMCCRPPASAVSPARVGSVAGVTVTGQIPVASVPAGSASYVQNTTSPQASSNFNISDTSTANVFNATTQFDIKIKKNTDSTD